MDHYQMVMQAIHEIKTEGMDRVKSMRIDDGILDIDQIQICPQRRGEGKTQ